MNSKFRKFLMCSSIIALMMLTCGLVGTRTIRPTSFLEASEVTVMILDANQESGGSGTIFHSSPLQTTVLTNSHICKLLTKGGVVITENQAQHIVTGFKQSSAHDLCLVTIASDLHINTEIANKAPSTYTPAMVSGHPNLLPTIVTLGHFARRMSIDVLVGIRECSIEDMKTKSAPSCLFFGGAPNIVKYQAEVISATIMPGSSGSAVFDSDGRIGSVIFAGSNGIGYGFAVPHDYLWAFINMEADSIPFKKPSPDTEEKTASKVKSHGQIKKECESRKDTTNKEIEHVCSIFEDNQLYFQE